MSDDEDFDNIPVKPRGAVSQPVANNQFHANYDEEDDEIQLNLPVKPRGANKISHSPPKARLPNTDDASYEDSLLFSTPSANIDKPMIDTNYRDEFVPKMSEMDLNDIDDNRNNGLLPQKTVSFDLPTSDFSKGSVQFETADENAEADGFFEEDFKPADQADFMLEDDFSFLEKCGESDAERKKRAEELARKSLYVKFDPMTSFDTPVKTPIKTPTSTTSSIPPDELFARDSPNTPSSNASLVARLQAVKQGNTPAKSSSLSANPLTTPAQPLVAATPLSAAFDINNETNPFSPQETPLVRGNNTEPLLYTQSDLDDVIRSREDDWNKKFRDLESKIKEEVAMRDLLEQDYREKLDCVRKENLEMKQVVEEYEKTIVHLTENTHHASSTNEETLAETLAAKEQLQQELSNTEATLVDAYKRVEKLKAAIDTYQSNEKTMKQSLHDFQEKLKRSEERYQALRKQAAEKVEAANVEINKVRKQKEIDQIGLEAAVRKAQTRINALEQDVEQKKQENAELTSICDELIKKVSGES